jgi:hypothetical protein
MPERVRPPATRKKRAMRRFATVVPILCALALATGLDDRAPRPLAAPVDVPTLLSADQTTDDGSDQLLVLVPALGSADLAPGSPLGGPALQAPWLVGLSAVSDLARAPPRQPAIRSMCLLRVAS